MKQLRCAHKLYMEITKQIIFQPVSSHSLDYVVSNFYASISYALYEQGDRYASQR